jgi:hypothetical protein
LNVKTIQLDSYEISGGKSSHPTQLITYREYFIEGVIAVLPRFNSAVDFQAQDELAEPR